MYTGYIVWMHKPDKTGSIVSESSLLLCVSYTSMYVNHQRWKKNIEKLWEKIIIGAQLSIEPKTF